MIFYVPAGNDDDFAAQGNALDDRRAVRHRNLTSLRRFRYYPAVNDRAGEAEKKQRRFAVSVRVRFRPRRKTLDIYPRSVIISLENPKHSAL
jgi:hypothetical protein